MSYAVALAGGGYLAAPASAAYRVGVGDFTVEVWARAAVRQGAGLVVLVDGVAVARPPQQVAADMHTVLGGGEAGLVGYWSFARQDGTDASAFRNDAVAVGPVTYTTPGAPVSRGITRTPSLTRVSYDQGVLHAEWQTVAQPEASGYDLSVLDQAQREVASALVPAGVADVQVRLAPGAAFTVRVRAVGADVAGPWSNRLPVLTTSRRPAGGDRRRAGDGAVAGGRLGDRVPRPARHRRPATAPGCASSTSSTAPRRRGHRWTGAPRPR